MSNGKRKNSYEGIVRLMCFLLGVFITIAGVLIKERIAASHAAPIQEAEEEKASENSVSTPEASAPADQTQDTEDVVVYEKEAEELYKEMVETAEQTPTPEVETDDDGMYLIADKPSKLNWNTDYPALPEGPSLEENEELRSSYDTTMTINALDRKIIEENTIDFSDVKITILGDSITAATNLDDEERAQYNYPKQLADILGCEVVNMGIGGSVVSRCIANYPMVDRWYEMSKDSDIIIIFGGTNDSLFMNKWQFGNIEYELRMNKGTFCGDLDEMVSACEWTYHEDTPDHYIKLIYINPMSTILNDGVYATDPGNMVRQEEFAKAINEIVPPYGFDVIDLYNTNFLNSHDERVNHEFVRDGVHPTPEGYRMIAEHIASQIIQRIN